MKRLSFNIYIVTLIVISAGLFVVSSKLQIDIDIGVIIFWGLLALISESYQITLPTGATTSVGMAIYIAAIITSGPLTALIAVTIAFLCRVQEHDGEKLHIFNLSPTISIFNLCSHIVGVGIMGNAIWFLSDSNTPFDQVIVLSLVMLSIIEFVGIFLLLIYYYTKFNERNIKVLSSFFGALPSTLAVGALGTLVAFAVLTYNKAIVALFFVPILLARYSFKLYFDSQKTGQETIEALDAALQYRDAYTAGHTSRVKVYTVVLAKKMGYHGKDLERIEKAALLHDIGKIGVPDRILNKPGKLTDEEYQRIKDHAAMGAQILSNVDGFKRITEIVRQHHERPDGRGYPDGLVGDEISLDASMLSIADTYDAMTSERPYRKAMTKEYAFSELRKYRGTQFRDELVDVFIECIEDMDEMALEFELPETYDDLLEKTKQEEIEKESTEVVYDS